MGGKQQGDAAAFQFAHNIQYFAHQFGVERRSDFVEQQHFGVERQRAGNGNALLLAAGQPVGVRVDLVGQAKPGKKRGSRFVGLIGRLLQYLGERKSDVATNAHVWKQVEALKHNADAPANWVCV